MKQNRKEQRIISNLKLFNIEIDKELFKKFKIHCINKDTSFREVIIRLIKKELEINK